MTPNPDTDGEESNVSSNSDILKEAEEKSRYYENEVNKNREKTKKAFMVAEIAAIIIIVAAAVALAVKKPPKEAVKQAIANTFNQESNQAKAAFIEDTLKNGKGKIELSAGIKNINAAYPNDFFSKDLKITKPSLKAEIFTDLKNETIFADVKADIANMIPDNPIFDESELTGEDGKTCASFSVYEKGDEIGYIDREGGNHLFERLNVVSFSHSILQTIQTVNSSSDVKMLSDAVTDIIEEAVIRDLNQGYSFKSNGKTEGANGYLVTIPEDKKADIKSKLDETSAVYDNAPMFDMIKTLIDDYSDEKTQIMIGEKNGYLRALSIVQKVPESENDSDILFTLNIAFNKISSGYADCVDVHLKTQDGITITLRNTFEDGKYILDVSEFSLDMPMSGAGISLSGSVCASGEYEDKISKVGAAKDSDALALLSGEIEKIYCAAVPSMMQAPELY